MNSASTKIKLKDKVFQPYISASEIESAVSSISAKLNVDLAGLNPLFLVVLNGSFMFAADLLRKIEIPCNISFVKMASYEGMTSGGSINELIGLQESVENRVVVIVEDIVDTGNTLEKLHLQLTRKKASKIFIAALLFKPEAYTKNLPVEYAGMRIGNDFVVGYGLDYDGHGRNLSSIYVLDES